MHAKKIVLYTLVFLLAAALLVGVWTQVIFTVQVSPTCVKSDFGYMPFLEGFAERYNSNTLEKYEHAVSFTGSLPSTNPEDYMDVRCVFDIQNRSLIDQYSINGTLIHASKYRENILLSWDANEPVTTVLFRNERGSANIGLIIYIGNLDEAQIRELVQGLEVSVKAYGDYLGTRSKTISYSECTDITLKSILSE